MTTNTILRYTIIAGLFSILFIPFIVADSQYFPFISGKGFTFRIIVEVLLALWVVLAIRDTAYAPKPSFILWSILGFLGIIGLADIFGELPYKSFWSNFERMEGYITLLHLAVYFLIAGSVLTTEKIWKYFWNTSIVASVVMALYSFLQLAGKITINQGGVRVDGTFGNATYLAVYMLFNFFLALWFFVRTKNIGARIWFGVAMVCQFIVLYKTATRGTILGLLGGLFVTTILIAIFEKKAPLMRKSAIGALIALVVIVGGFFLLRNADFIKNSPTLGRFASLSFSEVQSQGRYFVWPMALQGVKERPILGWGQENFNYVFNKYYNPEMFRHEQWFDRTHNVVLDWLIAGGILGFLAYISLYVGLFYYLFKSSLSVTEKSILTGLIAGYIFHNLFVFDNLISYVLFFGILAYIHGVHATQGKQTWNVVSRLKDNQYISNAVVPVLMVIIIAFTIYAGNIKPILANRSLIGGLAEQPEGLRKNLENFKKVFEYNSFGSVEASEQLLSNLERFTAGQVPEDIRNEYIELAKTKIEDQAGNTPNDARYALFAGSLFNRLGQFGEAIPHLERAAELSPKKQAIYLELGTAYLSNNDGPKALEQFKKAYDFAPEYEDARMAYAAAAIITGDTRLAEELLHPVPQEIIAFNPHILNAFVISKRFEDLINLLLIRTTVDPGNFNHYLTLAAAYLDSGQRTKAVEALRKVIEINPQFKDQGEYYIKEIQAGRNP